MTIEGIIVGLLAIAIGLAWAFYGLKLFTILLPIWAFFFGLVAGAQWGVDVFGQGFFSTVLSWGIGLVFGLVLAAISFFWYYAAIVILGGAVGYALGVGVFDYFGIGTGPIIVIIGLIVGAIFAIGTFVLGVPVLLVMVFSAFSGAAAVVNGVLLFLGQIKLEGLQEGIFGALFTNGILGTVIWLVLGAVALYWQMRDVGQTITSIDRTDTSTEPWSRGRSSPPSTRGRRAAAASSSTGRDGRSPAISWGTPRSRRGRAGSSTTPTRSSSACGRASGSRCVRSARTPVRWPRSGSATSARRPWSGRGRPAARSSTRSSGRTPGRPTRAPGWRRPIRSGWIASGR